MRRIFCLFLVLVLSIGAAVPALAAEFTLEQTAKIGGMGQSWYQGYEPTIYYHTMTLCLPISAPNCQGKLTASIALDDPNVLLLTAKPKAVTVDRKNDIYPVKLTLSLSDKRRNGDYPATVTLTGADAEGDPIQESLPYIIRIRDGYPSHETLTPVITEVLGQLSAGGPGSLQVTISNPSTTLSMTGGVLRVTDPTGDILMAGSDRFALPEILPGKTEAVTLPVLVSGNAAINTHSLQLRLDYQVLERQQLLEAGFTVPVSQEIRLEHGGVQLPSTVAGDMATLTLPVMNMGRGELRNVGVKLQMDAAMEAQSVLLGTVAPGETKQAKLTFSPRGDAIGTFQGLVLLTCEDGYGNSFSRELPVSLTVEEAPARVEDTAQEEEKAADPVRVLLIILCLSLAAALAAVWIIMANKLHKLEEERL